MSTTSQQDKSAWFFYHLSERKGGFFWLKGLLGEVFSTFLLWHISFLPEVFCECIFVLLWGFLFFFFLWSIQNSPLRITDTFFTFGERIQWIIFCCRKKLFFKMCLLLLQNIASSRSLLRFFLSSLRIWKQGLFRRRRANPWLTSSSFKMLIENNLMTGFVHFSSLFWFGFLFMYEVGLKCE